MPSRRRTILGLGGLMLGGGALVSTGAFDTVEAERTVSVETADDANAFLGLQIRADVAAGGELIDLAPLNIESKGTIERALFVRNQGTQDGIGIDTRIEINGRTEGAEEIFRFERNPGLFDDGSEEGIDASTEGELDPGDATAYDLVINLREDELSDAANQILDKIDPESFEVTVTIEAGQDVEGGDNGNGDTNAIESVSVEDGGDNDIEVTVTLRTNDPDAEIRIESLWPDDHPGQGGEVRDQVTVEAVNGTYTIGGATQADRVRAVLVNEHNETIDTRTVQLSP